jgi:vacuolar-type H+-ATPase subunit H
MDNMIDRAKGTLFGGGKKALDAEELRRYIDDLRLALPNELRIAKTIISDQKNILSEAQSEADGIIRKAEERARQLVNQEEIVRTATKMAMEKKDAADARAKVIRKTAEDYAEKTLQDVENIMSQRLDDIRRAKQSLNNRRKASADTVSEEAPADVVSSD